MPISEEGLDLWTDSIISGMVGKPKEFSDLSAKVDSVCGSVEKGCSFCTAYGVCITFLLTVKETYEG